MKEGGKYTSRGHDCDRFPLISRYYLNEKRYLLDHNKPGDTWYRMPAVAVIKATFDGGEGLPAQEDEGTFYDGGGELGDEFAGNRIVLVSSLCSSPPLLLLMSCR